MREILFKAKRVDNGEWVEGSLYTSDEEIAIGNMEFSDCFIIKKGKLITNYGVDGGLVVHNKFIQVISDTVCQYTELTDKNGVKIFEGDIIKWKCYNGAYYERPVQYDTEWNRFCVWLNGAESCGVNKHLSSDIEVIGNIHDKEQNNG